MKPVKCYLLYLDQSTMGTVLDFIERCPEIKFVRSCSSVADFLTYYASEKVENNIAFVDLDGGNVMGDSSLRELECFTQVVFYGSSKDLAADAFDLGAVDFLLKPFSENRFNQCIKKVKNKLDAAELLSLRLELPYFFIQSEVKGKFMRIMKEEIVYVECALNYLHIHLDGKVCSTYLTIKELECTLHFPQFVRVHKSFIINMDRVIGVEGNMISLDSKVASSKDIKVPLGPNYRDAFFERINSVLVKSKRLVM